MVLVIWTVRMWNPSGKGCPIVRAHPTRLWFGMTGASRFELYSVMVGSWILPVVVPVGRLQFGVLYWFLFLSSA
jgi:hypothetical protein